MPRIRCHYIDCVFLDEGYCSAAAVEIELDTGCATYSPTEGSISVDDWDEDELEEWDEENEEDLWLDEEDDL